MIDLDSLAELAAAQRPFHRAEVAPLRLGGALRDTEQRAVIMAAVNLSGDSTYRTSIAPDTESAVRKSMIAVADGAEVVDLGAESSNERAGRVPAAEQARVLLPVVQRLHAAGVVISVESYFPSVIEGMLDAGASVVNLTGSADDDAVFTMTAQAQATLLLCYVPGQTVRDAAALPAGRQGIQQVVDTLRPRLDRALERGVTSVAVDPGIGFSYANLSDPMARIAVQSRYLLLSGTLRQLGYPVLQSLPNAFALFQEHYRTAEGYFAVLALLGGAGMLRVHEVGQVRAVREALSVDLGGEGW